MARTDPRPHYGQKRRTSTDGYVSLWKPDHPLARRDGYVAEHRYVAWEAGLLTDPADDVHHRNEVRDDNRLENLEVKTKADHAREHAEERGVVTNQHGTFSVRPADERRTAPKEERPCAGCDGTVPATARRDARYCSGSCRVRTFKRSRR